MYDEKKVIRFVETLLEFFLRVPQVRDGHFLPLDKEMFSMALTLYHKVNKSHAFNKGHLPAITKETEPAALLCDILYCLSGNEIEKCNITKLLDAVDSNTLEKWTNHILE